MDNSSSPWCSLSFASACWFFALRGDNIKHNWVRHEISAWLISVTKRQEYCYFHQPRQLNVQDTVLVCLWLYFGTSILMSPLTNVFGHETLFSLGYDEGGWLSLKSLFKCHQGYILTSRQQSAMQDHTQINQLEQNSGYASIQLIQFGSGAQRIGTKLQATALLLCVHTSSIYLCQLLNSFFFRIVTNWFLGVIHQTPFLRRNSIKV